MGTYRCTHEEGGGDVMVDTMVVTQEIRDDVHYFTFNGSEMVADNAERPFVGDPTFRNGSLRAWCENDVFRSRIAGQFFENEVKTGEMEVTVDVSFIDGKMIEKAHGLHRNAGGEIPTSGLVTCVPVTDETVIARAR